jgi:hypothetical protein
MPLRPVDDEVQPGAHCDGCHPEDRRTGASTHERRLADTQRLSKRTVTALGGELVKQVALGSFEHDVAAWIAHTNPVRAPPI